MTSSGAFVPLFSLSFVAALEHPCIVPFSFSFLTVVALSCTDHCKGFINLKLS